MPDQAVIHRRCCSERIEDRQKAVELLGRYFSILSDKAQAWLDLVRLAQDRDHDVRSRAIESLGLVFGLVLDKDQAWLDLVRLTQNKDSYVRSRAVYILRTTFCLVPDKNQAWLHIVGLTKDEDHNVRWGAAYNLGFAFGLVTNKNQAWLDLARLTQDKDYNVRWGIACALEKAFGLIPDRNQAWMKLHKLTQDKDRNVRWGAVGALGTAFGLLPDKDQVWLDLSRLTHDKDHNVRRRAAHVLGTVFRLVPDKDQAWIELRRLTRDESSDVRRGAAYVLGTAFGLVPDKDQAWIELRRLTQDENSEVRRGAAYVLGTVFRFVSNKDQAWLDLIRLIQDDESVVRRGAVGALGIAFGLVHDKDQAWVDLVDLTQDRGSDVRRGAAYVLGTAFSLVPDKDQAWLDLDRLTQDESIEVRRGVAGALGTAFSLVPDKDQAWLDLIRLTQDEDSEVRMFSYHSLGRASVFKATKTDDRKSLKMELENAIDFFERSSQESAHGPARFCRPFYRSYFAITFQGASEEEVQKYLVEAKDAVGGSESKDELLKVVENLALALQESQRLKDKPFKEVTSELNAYRWYCEKAAEHMAAAEDKAPMAVMLMSKCNPLLEDQIQTTITEIQAKAKLICQITRKSGTEFEVPGAEINKAAKALSSEDIKKTENSISRIAFQLEEFCRLLPEGKRELVCAVVKEIECASEFSDKVGRIELAITYVSSAVVNALQPDIRSRTNQVIHKANNVDHMLDGNRIKILFLAANPEDTNMLALDDEIREITSKLRSAEYRDSIELISAWAVRTDDLLQLLNQHKPQIVHFSGHGTDSGELILNDNYGVSKPVSSRAIRALFTTLKDNIRVVVLNACYSIKQAEAITQVIDCVVGMNDSIGDKAAITFAASFYRAIGFGRSIEKSFDQGITALLLEGILEENTPKLLVKNGVDPSQVTLVK